jgi:hypothetical protein
MTANVLRILGMIATPVSQRIGVAALRISIAIVFLWIGALKFVPYEADSITVRGQQSRDVLLLQASRGLQGPPYP